MSDLEQIAYDNAIRALYKQEKLLEELRARTGVLLAAASLAVSLLGGRAFDDLRPVLVLAAALTAFALAFVASLFVWEDNDERMAPVRRAFRLAASSLVVEVLTLTVPATGIL